MHLFDHFDFLAPIYDNAIPFKGLGDWVKFAGLPVEGSLLDIGGGTGRVAGALKAQAGHVVVADLSPGMLKQAREKQIDALRCYSERLSFANDSFERAIMVDAFHHIIHGEETAAEMWRVLRPGGRLVIHEPDIRSPLVWVVAIVEKLALMRSRFVSPPKIAAMFTQYPNASVKIHRSGYTAWIVVDKLAA